MNDLKFTTAGEYMSSPKVYEENIDYELTPASDNEYGWNVRILVGPFVETVIRFGNLAAYEKEGLDVNQYFSENMKIFVCLIYVPPKHIFICLFCICFFFINNI